MILAEIVRSVSYDDGVLDLGGSNSPGRPVAPIQGEDGGWQLQGAPGTPPVDPPSSIVHHPRTHYQSKRADQVLAEVGQTAPALIPLYRVISTRYCGGTPHPSLKRTGYQYRGAVAGRFAGELSARGSWV